ncbi:2-(3-amino-3-carboxypropyl)histidine synthase [Nematocida displodere]|uniref:2-(3-amino-3-carboxypropyl)histidine synthase subunit 1 n=1 Tax=Nematocida displodere TaxID=1805483 RepID=A0A177ELF6_9MICR|nr:2-(3-amino-3-carboxypropyl)histidine synthase [Nematocida displodere]
MALGETAGAEYLPSNYRFEIEKTIRQIKRRGSKKIALQFPEGIIHLSTVISDIIRCSTEVESVTILSDVVYGACCIDDISSHLIGCDLLVHYGHSCLFEVPKCLVGVVYVFVEVSIDYAHCVDVALKHIDCSNLSVLGTIQYSSVVRGVRKGIEEARTKLLGSAEGEGVPPTEVKIPRVMPLSVGEVLGCTSPKVQTENVLFIAEGRFHLESVMIQNPTRKYYRYCPATKTLKTEQHDYARFLSIRKERQAASRAAKSYTVIFGTLGRQGGMLILQRVLASLVERGAPHTTVYLSEIDNETIASIDKDSAVIEIACPRIAIDWGSTFTLPIITPFEYFTMIQGIEEYPMDYYKKEGRAQPWQMLR